VIYGHILFCTSVKYFKKFNSIDKDYLRSDKHIHTSWVDGELTISEIITAAHMFGLNQVAITEHVRSDSTYVKKYFDEISETIPHAGLEVLPGFEAKVMDFNGNIDVSEDVLKKGIIRIASVHRFPLGRKLYAPLNFNKNLCQEIELELSMAAARNGKCNVLGHPGGMSLQTYGEFPPVFFDEIAKQCAKYSVAFELNSAYHIPVLYKLMDVLKKRNPFVSLGSDAHMLKDVGNCSGMFNGGCPCA
jgi:putative hydrolase